MPLCVAGGTTCRGFTSVEGLGFVTNPSTKWKLEKELTRSINVKGNLFLFFNARRRKVILCRSQRRRDVGLQFILGLYSWLILQFVIVSLVRFQVLIHTGIQPRLFVGWSDVFSPYSSSSLFDRQTFASYNTAFHIFPHWLEIIILLNDRFFETFAKPIQLNLSPFRIVRFRGCR